MPEMFNVTITPVDSQDSLEQFEITWLNRETLSSDSFIQPAIPSGSFQTEPSTQKALERHQYAVGGALFDFLDGPSRIFMGALDHGHRYGQEIIIYLETCIQVQHWPFELLARGDDFLLGRTLHLVRCVNSWGIKKIIPPVERPLKLLFIASAPIDITPCLNFEKEEETFFQITDRLAVHMDVEDSGTLEGLQEQLFERQYDVIHLSGHAGIDDNSTPYFIMETETGEAEKVTADRLLQDALIENPPRMVFLSFRQIGENHLKAVDLFARSLVEFEGIHHVLSWDQSVNEFSFIEAGKIIYSDLSRGKNILEALQRARRRLMKTSPGDCTGIWPTLRLFGTEMPIDAIVADGLPYKPFHRSMKHAYLKNSGIQVLTEGFIGRRRQLQQSLKALKHNDRKAGVLLMGAGGLGKSCLAGKIIERFSRHTVIAVRGVFNTITFQSELADVFTGIQDAEGRNVLGTTEDMSDKLAALCATSFKRNNYLILLDDFERNLDGWAQGKPGALLPESARLLSTLLHYLPVYSGRMTRLIITSRYPFSLSKNGRCLVDECLEKVWLSSFPVAEIHKKALSLKNTFNHPEPEVVSGLLAAGHGNPRLMEWIELLADEKSSVDVCQLLQAVKDKQEFFIRGHVIRELLQGGGHQLSRFLAAMNIYRLPVSIEGVERMGREFAIPVWPQLLRQAIDLTLAEHDTARDLYAVTPFLREELVPILTSVEMFACHRAAFNYYDHVCKSRESIQPLWVEEWIFHGLNCGEEDMVSKLGARLINHLRENLAFYEAVRVGEEIVLGKIRPLSDSNDGFLLNALAYSCYHTGAYDRAIKYYRHALDIFEKKNHQKDAATTMNNLGEVWRALDEPRKAIEYYEKALEIDKKIHGKNHPNVAREINNLGEAFREMGELRKAIEYYQEAYSILKDVHGEEHHRLAIPLNNMGTAWKALEEYPKAIELYKQALALWQDFYKGKHQHIASALHNLGAAYLNLGENEKARGYFEAAYAMKLELYSQNHPSSKLTARYLNLLK